MFSKLASEFLRLTERTGLDEAKQTFKELQRLREEKEVRQVFNACGIYEQRIKSGELDPRSTDRRSDSSSQAYSSCSTPLDLALQIPVAVALHEQNQLLESATSRLIQGSDLSDILNLVTEKM